MVSAKGHDGDVVSRGTRTKNPARPPVNINS